MSAKNGLTRSFRLIGCLAAVALLCSALFASVASAKKTPPTNKTAYIALGDSVSYGYSAQKFAENLPGEPASAYDGGLVDLLAEKLAKKEAKLGNLLETRNLSCPGEASKGLIGIGPMAEELIAKSGETHFTEGEAPCGWFNSTGFPRHTEYGSVSQMEAAVALITAGNEVGGIPVKDVTLQIGSNDELHKLGQCANEAYLAAHGFGGFIECLETEAKNTLFPAIINNLGLDVSIMRKAGYEGPIALLGFYNPQALLVGGSDPLQKILNESLEATIAAGGFGPHVAYGNPFKKTNPQGKKTETSVERQALEKAAICKYTEECNMFDKKVTREGEVKHPVTEAEVTEHETLSGKMTAGDIHPTHEGHVLFSKTLYSALKKA